MARATLSAALSALFFYLDDGYIVARPDVAEHILVKLENALAGIGLSMNMTKLQVRAADPSTIPDSLKPYYTADIRVLKKHLVTPGDAEHQGMAIAASRQNLSQETERLTLLTSKLRLLVKAGLDLQTAVSMFEDMQALHRSIHCGAVMLRRQQPLHMTSTWLDVCGSSLDELYP